MTRPTRRPRTAPKPAGFELGPAKRSWTALLAATTLGLAGASVVHADVQSDARLDEKRTYRLVVQSYDENHGETPEPSDRPVASAQREVTAEQLRAGVRVGLLELRQDGREADARSRSTKAKRVVLAWIEEGRADLELDGLRARPQPGSLRGAAERTADGTVQISVRHPVAVA